MLSRGGPSDDCAEVDGGVVVKRKHCVARGPHGAVVELRNFSARWRIASRSASAKPTGALGQATAQATAQSTFWSRLDPQKRQGDDSYAVGAAVRLGTGGEDDEVGDVATHLLLEPVEVTDVPVIDSRC